LVRWQFDLAGVRLGFDADTSAGRAATGVVGDGE
jgi:hypothetical protein